MSLGHVNLESHTPNNTCHDYRTTNAICVRFCNWDLSVFGDRETGAKLLVSKCRRIMIWAFISVIPATVLTGAYRFMYACGTAAR